MAIKRIAGTTDLVSDVEEQGVTRVLNTHFHELLSLGPSSRKNVYRILRDYLISHFSLDYFSKLNLIVKTKSVHTKEKESNEMSRWIDSDVMESIDEIFETDVFDNPKSLSALADILLVLHSSLAVTDEEDIEGEIDSIFDMPYQLHEMIMESSRIPRFYTHSFKHEELGWSERASISMSGRSMSLSYTRDLRK